nr:RNA-binding protein NOB1-like isoform X2 [Cherax quadricarinatus]
MKCKRLVVDTAAFVKNVPLWEYGEELYSLPEVIEEIRDKQTRQRLEAMPVAIKMRQPQAHSVRFVNEFSKKTGDYASLSLADIKVLALTYELEVEVQGGSEHLCSEPQRIITEGAAKKTSKSSVKLAEGFYHPAAQDEKESLYSVQKDEEGTAQSKQKDERSTQSEQKDEEGTTQSEEKDKEGTTQSEEKDKEGTAQSEEKDEKGSTFSVQKDEGSRWSVQKDDSLLPSDLKDIKMFSQLDQKADEEFSGLDPLEPTPVDLSSLSLLEHTVAENCSEDENNEEELVGSHLAEEGEDQEEHEEDNDNLDDGSDDEGWITPSNIKKHKIKNSDFVNADELQDDVQVACITADFAVQNVLKHIGLPIIGVDGKFIRHLRTYILRCYACFRTTSVMTKIFCPHCGNKTLKKVSVTVNPDGTQKIWINTKRPINIKGTKYSLPTPKGGKHGRNPILVEDQREAKRFSSKMSWNKINPLHEDYNPDQMPFAVRDVYSRAAQLGYIAGKNHHHYYWERKNPNQPMRRTGKKKGK